MDISIRTVYTTAKPHVCLWLWLSLFLVIFPNNSRGLSDLKICGDPGCEISMCRVLATKNFEAPDCRFLSFRKGDVIFVEYKLAGKRDDLWAGSKDRMFGYFPKDAVKVDEILVSEERQMTLPTEKHDFFCMDEYGEVIEIDDSEEYEEQHPENEEELHGTSEGTDIQPSTSNNKDTDQIIPEDLSDKVPPEASEQGGSSWMGSAVTGWFDTTDKSNADSDNHDDNLFGNDEKQDTFRKRKLALDDEQLEEKPSMFGWIGGELTNVLGYGETQAEEDAANTQNADGERLPGEEKPAENQEEPSGQYSPWLNIGIRDVLKFGGGEKEEVDKPMEEIKEIETTETTTDSVIPEGNEGSLESPQASIEVMQKEDMMKEDDGWYGGMYNSFAGYYTEKTKVEHPENDVPLSKTEDSENIPVEKTIRDRDEGESLISSDGLSSVLENVSSQTFSDMVKDNDDIQSREQSNLSPQGEYLVKDYLSSEGEKMSLDIDRNRKHSSLKGVDDTDDQEIPSEEKEESVLPVESQIDDGRDEEPPSVSETESEEKTDLSVPYDNKDDIFEVPSSEKEPHLSGRKSNYDTADSTGQPDVSDGSLHDLEMSESTSEKASDPVQSNFVTNITDTKERTNLSPPGEEHLVKDDLSSEGEKMSLDIDRNRKHSSLKGVDDTDDQEIPSEEKEESFLPVESQIDDGRDEEPPSVSETESEEKLDLSVPYDNKDEIRHDTDDDTAYSTGQPDVSDDSLHDLEMSESTSEKASDPVQSNFVTHITDTKEITSTESGSTEIEKSTQTLSDESLKLLDKFSFKMDSTSDTEVATSDQESEHNIELEKASVNTQEYSNHITSVVESNIDSDKELIANNQRPDSDKPEESTNFSLPEESTELLSLIQSKESEEPQPLDQDTEKHQGQTSSSDFPPKTTDNSEPNQKTADDQFKHGDEILGAGSSKVHNDVTSNDLMTNQTKAKHDYEAQEKLEVLDEADLSIMDNRNDAQQKVPNESMTERMHTEWRLSDTLSTQSYEDMASHNSSAVESLARVDLESSESIIDVPDESETASDSSQTNNREPLAETLKEDETESETIEASGNSDTPTQRLEHHSEIYRDHETEFQSDSSVDNTPSSRDKTVIEDTHKVPDIASDSYISFKTDETATIRPSPHSRTMTEEQDAMESEPEVTISSQMEVQEKGIKDSEADSDSTTAVMNGHLDSVKLGEDNNVHPPHEQSIEYIQTEHLIKEDEKNTGWFGSVYNGVAGLYGEKTKPDDTGDVVSPSDTAETPTPEGIPNEEDTVSTQETQSVFSIDGLSSVFESLTSKPQTDTAGEQGNDQHNEESSPEKSLTDLGCLQGTCTSSTQNEKVASKDGESADELQDSANLKGEGEHVQEDVKHTVIQDESVSVEDSAVREDTAVSDHTPTVQDQYEFLNGERTKSDRLTEGVYKSVTSTDMDAGQTAVLLKWFLNQVVSSLPDDLRPGPDLYGMPWEAVIFTALLGLGIMLLFSCRLYLSVKSRLYARRERRLGQKVAEMLEEKCKVLEQLSEAKKKHEKMQAILQNGGLLADIEESQKLESMSRELQESNAQMNKDVERLTENLNTQRSKRMQEEQQLGDLQATLKNLQGDATDFKSQIDQAKTTLKIHNMNSERLEKKLQASIEENVMLKESKDQLSQEAEGWGERLAELEEEMNMCESSYLRMQEDCAKKDDRIKSLTEVLLKMKDWDSDLEDEANGDSGPTSMGRENGDETDHHRQQKVQKLIYAAKLSADLRSLEEDKNRVVAKLSDEIKAKEDLHEGIEQLERQKEQLVAESSTYTLECQKLQQKLAIMTEMYHENELKLHRMLTVEERERLQKEEKLNKADMKICFAAEELSNYRVRAEELAEELERTNQAYKNQIASHEKKAHDNWLAARGADRDLGDIKRENAHLRQKLTDYQFKLEVLEKDPYALDAPGRPLFRGERSPYGPSPLGRPASETRAFLSPPTLMDGPPRLSPQFPMGPGGRGHPYPESGPPFRRPPPGAFPMGPLPPRPPFFPEGASHSFGSDVHPSDKPDSSFVGNASGISEAEGRDASVMSAPGDMRMPPDAEMRMGPPGMGPPPPHLDPRDPHFQRRGPYGHPDFFPPRGPGGLPMGMRGPPPGMFPRYPLPPHMGYPPMRPPLDSFPPGPHGPPPRPSPPGSEQPPDQTPSPQDAI
ncbi:melanoma inhibitory activity protein 2 isoform X3 [Clupea harengus]|uniref:Melanoma inhibitory activity protein 2 isoform X3 n=1 Tax=Clupea harengus TaxID=7950 RepID=A0A6P8GFF8_CLUHA|nr:melanoma inhibitory activity protein 2 isoform X3 [Clupea harengus]